ncbi:hypothetical protein DB30_00105 [Enhygromyxa salina]|uniref:Uncharacterized protein n=1 Tax=Enhygromyxa salina TaxID=215803 RepID=A0A0C2D955_9BACT|nr:hypothetical protein [Enhygromyxa salina]KIG19596.1 hypothetical protein DB30_00105 [Enhygromyxa salina]
MRDLEPTDAGVRLQVLAEAIEPSLRAILDEVDRLAPRPTGPHEGEIVDNAVAVGDGTFIALTPTPRRSATQLVVNTVSVVIGLGLGAGLMLNGVALESAFVAGGITMAAPSGIVSLWLGARQRAGTKHTGLLCLPDRLVIRYPTFISVLPRSAVLSIEERMHEEPGSQYEGPSTVYSGVVVFNNSKRERQELAIVDARAKGEAGLSLRASHIEGQYVTAVVRYLVRRWLKNDPAERTKR